MVLTKPKAIAEQTFYFRQEADKGIDLSWSSENGLREYINIILFKQQNIGLKLEKILYKNSKKF